MDFETRTTDFLRQSVDGICRQEQTQEVIVPDSDPDASRILYCCAQAVVRSKTCAAGSIQIAGGVQICALYACEADEIARAVDAYLPFTLRLDHPAAGEDTQALLDCRVCTADARLVNSRKILFRAEVGAQILGYSPASADIPLLKDTPKGLQLRCRTYPLRLPAETAEKSFLLSEELALPAGQIAAEKIAAMSVLPEITEQRLIGNKAVFKGTMQVQILYFAADHSLNRFSQSLPFSQYCQLQADYDEDAIQILPLVTGCDAQLLTPSGAAGFLLSVNLLAQCLVWKTVTRTFCEDAFATRGELKPEWYECTFDCLLDRKTQTLPLREAIRSEALRSVVDSTLFVDFPRAERTPQGLRITIPASVRILGTDAEGALCGAAGNLEAAAELPAGDGTNCLVLAQQEPDGYAAPAPGGAEVRGGIMLDICTSAEQTFRTLSGGSIEPPPDETVRRPSVVLRAVPSGTQVWALAKEYRTDLAAICAANALNGEETETDGMLLIPMGQ